MKEIRLNNGAVSIVDDDLYEVLSSYHWSFSGGGSHGGYAYAKGGKYMHRLVIGATKDQIVDHKNGNTLDNRRENLRVCTQQENRRNSRKMKTAASPYKGVMRVKNREAWRAIIKVGGKPTYLGYFKQEVDAARAYNEAAKKFFGEFAVLNEI